MHPCFRGLLPGLAAVAMAAPALAAEPSARAAFSRQRIMPTEEVQYTITLSAERLPRNVAVPRPDFADFDVIDGPGVSSSQSVSIINGQVEQSVMRTFTWLLQPKKEGQLSVPATTIDIGGGQRVQAGRVAIEVSATGGSLAPPPGRMPPGAAPPPTGGPADRPRARPEPNRPWQQGQQRQSQPRLEVAAVVDQDEVWEGQEITLSHVLRYDVDVSTYSLKSAPDFPGFANTPQQIPQPEGKPVRDPQTGAILYHEAVLSRWSLVPLTAGTKEIPPQGYVITIQEDPFRSIFGGGFGRSPFEQQVAAATSAVAIKVKRLPEGAPPSFSGAVGSFRLQGSLDASQVKAGEGLTLTLVVDGAGSFRRVEPPRVAASDGLKLFDPEVSEKAGLDPQAKTQGTKTFKYPVLVTSPGPHQIPAVEWTFFDPSTARYVTRSAGPFSFEATPGEAPPPGMAAAPLVPAQAAVQAQGQDIRHILPSEGSWRPDIGQAPPGRWVYWLLGLGPALNAGMLLVSLLGRLRSSDAASLRAQGAARRARARLKEAKAALASGDALGASDAAARAVAGVVSDRLHLGAELSPGEAAGALVAASAPALAAEVERLLSDCDVARFASGTGAVAAKELVARAESLVTQLLAARLPRKEAA